jgi:hypothetical protein
MLELSTDVLGTACRIFLERSYPAGVDSIPTARRHYLDLPEGMEVAEYHSQRPFPAASFQVIRNGMGQTQGYALRLGSSLFPHLKLKVIAKERDGVGVWIFAVDTHDAFSREKFQPPADHPDAEAWTRLQEANAQLKEEIERAWEDAGLLTFNGLLRQGLRQSGSASQAS